MSITKTLNRSRSTPWQKKDFFGARVLSQQNMVQDGRMCTKDWRSICRTGGQFGLIRDRLGFLQPGLDASLDSEPGLWTASTAREPEITTWMQPGHWHK